MKNFKISLLEKISEATEAKMSQGVQEYALSHGINIDWKPFARQLNKN